MKQRQTKYGIAHSDSIWMNDYGHRENSNRDQGAAYGASKTEIVVMLLGFVSVLLLAFCADFMPMISGSRNVSKSDQGEASNCVEVSPFGSRIC